MCVCIFLLIIFAASICDLILTTLITYYRVFCIRHHSKNTVSLPHSLSLSDILLTERRWSSIDRNRPPSLSLSVSFQWNYVGYDPRWLFRVHLRALSCMYLCVELCELSVCEHIQISTLVLLLLLWSGSNVVVVAVVIAVVRSSSSSSSRNRSSSQHPSPPPR